MIDKIYVQAFLEGILIDRGLATSEFKIEERSVDSDNYWFVMKLADNVAISIHTLIAFRMAIGIAKPKYKVEITFIDGLIDFFISEI